MIAKPSDIKPESSFGWRGLVERAWQSGRSMLGYDAVEATGRRRNAAATNRSEDLELDATKRRLMQSQSRDVLRNFALASWAVRKHLDFVSRFTFASNTKTDFDKQLEDLIAEASMPGAFEVTGMMSRDQAIRSIEARAVADGDCLFVKLSDGRVQFITSDRVRDGGPVVNVRDNNLFHGVRVNDVGRPQSFAIHRRLRWGSFQFEREVPAEHVFFHAYREGVDQVRGITPLSSGLNAMQDVYEGFDYALQKAKISQLFGLVFYRDGVNQVEGLKQTEDAEAAEEAEEGAGTRYDVDLRGGPFKLELEGSDRAEWMESKTPSVETMELLKTMIGVSLKSLDIPLCFYDEGLTNFFGQRAALILYLESCKTKRQNLRTNVLDPWTRWKISQWVIEGRLVLPAGLTVETVPFTWQPAGCPYWNPSQEVNADVQAIKAGLATFEDVYRERTGRDWFADMERLSEQYKHLQRLGLPIDPQLVPIVMSPQAQGSDNAFQAALASLSV